MFRHITLVLLFITALNIFGDSFAPSALQLPNIDRLLSGEAPALTRVDEAPNIIVHNHVHVISGLFFDNQVDLELEPFGLNLERTYTSQDHLRGSLAYGWSHNLEDGLLTDNRPNHRYAISKGKSSGEYLYKGRYEESNLKIDGNNFKRGVTNCTGAGISGRTNVINNKLTRTKGKKYALKTGSGSLLEFDKPLKKKHTYQIVHQQTPNAHHIHYNYDTYIQKVKDVIYQNSHGQQLAKLSFEHPSSLELNQFAKKKIKGQKNPRIKIYTGDGRYVRYKLGCFISDVETDLDNIDYRRFRIIQATRSNGPEETFEYSPPKTNRPEMMIKKSRPDGRYLAIDYYKKGKSFVIDKVKTLKGPAGCDPNPVILYQFSYEKTSSTNAKTIVQDGLGHRTLYHYNPKNHRLNSIERQHSIERFHWGEEDKGSPLLAREIYDHAQELVLKRTYDYDNCGNVLKSTIEGNLTGNSSTDRFSTSYSYTNDGFNLVTSIREGAVHKEISYREGTDLVTAEYTHAGVFSKRAFYEYDDNNKVCTIIQDDGTGKNRDDYSGVTERVVQRIQNTMTAPIGLPEVIESLFVDLPSQREILLKRLVKKYDTWGRCIEESTYDSTGSFAYSYRWEYDDYGQIVKEVDSQGTTTLFSYDLNGNRLTETRLSDNRHKKHTYDLCNRLIKTETHDGASPFVETFQYDVMGNKIASTNIYGETTRYQYDSQGNLCTIIHPETIDTDLASYFRKEYREYDPLGNRTVTIDGNGHRTTTLYTARNTPYFICHADGTRETYAYSLSGNLIKYTNGNGTTFVTDYDELSRPIQEKTYDTNGNCLRTCSKRYNSLHLIEEIDAEGVSTSYKYDGAGRLVQTIKGNYVQTIIYDSLGRKCEVREGSLDGNLQTCIINKIQYDTLDRVILEETFSGDNTLQRHHSCEYDLDGNKTLERTYNASGECLTHKQYNAIGQLIQLTDAEGYTTHITHDVVKLDYRPVHRSIMCNPMGIQTIRYYDPVGELIREEVLNSIGEPVKRTHYRYDRAGNRTVQINDVINPVGEQKISEVRWGYDRRNRLVFTSERMNKSKIRYLNRTYDGNGNLIFVIKPDGVTLCYTYDALGRVVRYYSSDNTIDYGYEYNRSGKPVAIHDHVAKTTNYRRYNDNQVLVEERFDNGLQIGYEVDALGRMTQMTYPDASSVHYSYNGIRLQKVERYDVSGNSLYEHLYTQYDLSGNVIEASLINGLGTLTQDFDRLNRCAGINSPFWCEEQHVYDTTGNLLSRRIDNKASTYTYNALNQLETESGEFENRYVNDSMNNQVVVNGATREFNAVHELQGVYQYDINGNVIAKGDTKYFYDALNRLVKVELPHQTYEYGYDSFHRRILKQSADNSLCERYFYMGELELGAANEAGELIQVKVLGKLSYADVGAAVAVELEGKIYAPLHDQQGNIVALVDGTSGEVAERCSYSAYGQELNGEKKLSPWRCASKRYDAETGFMHFGRRYYDAAEMRWTTLDPVLLAEGENRYNYLKNSPFRYVDPDGRMIWMLAIPAIISWGTAAGVTIGISVSTTTMVCVAAVAGLTAGYLCDKGDISTRSLDIRFVGGSSYTTPSSHFVESGYDFSPSINQAEVPGSVTAPPQEVLNPTSVQKTEDMNYINKRSTHCDPDSKAEGSPHTVIEQAGPNGKYTTFNPDGTVKQYRGSGKSHGGIPRPNIKENTINESPKGPIPGRPTVRPALPEEIPGGLI